MKKINIEELLDYCENDKERLYITTRINSKSNMEAARKLGIDRHTVSKYIKKIYARKQAGLVPEDSEVAPKITQPSLPFDMEENKTGELLNNDFFVKGESTLYDADGNVKIKWVKTKANEEQFHKAILKAYDSILSKLESKDWNPVPKLSKKQVKKLDKNEATVYPVGDLHVGLFSWDKETGDDYDLEIAHNLIIKALTKLVNSAPDTETAFLLNLGDFFHIDNYQGDTVKSSNRLDFDTRWPKVLETGLTIIIEMINILLQKHNKIIIRNAIGNHDSHSSLFLNAYIKAWFKNDPRVEIHDNPTTFWYHKWGKNLIGVTHGDTIKITDLPEIMAADASDYWSDTKHRYWYIGHVHHMQKKEFRTCSVESFGILAAKDAWHTSQGYRSERTIKYKVLHKEFGEIQEGTVNVQMIKDK